MMKANLRVAATFKPEISAEFGVPGMDTAIIVDDQANILHEIHIEYAEEDSKLYRRLTYTMKAMQTTKKILTCQNEVAQQLLYKMAASLSGSTLSEGRAFEKAMFILPKDEVWDDVLPTDKPAAKKTLERAD